MSDVILLGTDEQVRLAAQAAADMVACRRVETAALVVSLRSFVREVLELDPFPAGRLIPDQGPLRAGGASGRGGRDPSSADLRRTRRWRECQPPGCAMNLLGRPLSVIRAT